MIKGLAGAAIGGLAGALVWTLIGYFLNVEVGWIAWGIGALVGFGMAKGAEESTNTMTGVIAAVIALVTIAGGKYAVVYLQVDKALAEAMASADSQLTMDDVKVALADQVVEEFTQEGKKVEWAEGMTLETAESQADYPKDVWAEADKRFTGMPEADRDAMLASMKESQAEFMAVFAEEFRSQGFKDSLSPWDALWAILALGTAFKLGSGAGEN